MATWKLCASTTFEILPLSTCTLCQIKSCISRGIHTTFEMFASARRCWGWAFGSKISGAQLFYFCNAKVKSFRIDNILKFCYVQPVPGTSQNPMSPKVLNQFSKSLPQVEDVEGGHLCGKFQVRRYFTLAIRTWNFRPKCPPSTSSSRGKHFESRVNTSGDTGFYLAQCTCWKWQNFKCCRCAKFSRCHCKTKIPAYLKFSTQMPTLNIF